MTKIKINTYPTNSKQAQSELLLCVRGLCFFKGSVLAHVLHVNSVFSESVCELLLSLISMYMRMELKGQRASRKSLQSGILRQDFPYSKLKCMRGLISEEELTRAITQVVEREKSFVIWKRNVQMRVCRISFGRAPTANLGKKLGKGKLFSFFILMHNEDLKTFLMKNCIQVLYRSTLF